MEVIGDEVKMIHRGWFGEYEKDKKEEKIWEEVGEKEDAGEQRKQ